MRHSRSAAMYEPVRWNGIEHGPQAANDCFQFWKLPQHWMEHLRGPIETSQEMAEWYLLEKYLPERRRRPPLRLRPYYLVKNLIPPSVRYWANGMLVRRRRRLHFPCWPYEGALLRFRCEWLDECVGSSEDFHIGFWPEGRRCCVVLTHDVDSREGFERMEAMAEIEEHCGFRSAWNLPLAQYPIDWRRVERLRSAGFEFGAHGLSHDGRLFRSRRDFEQLAPELMRLAAEHRLQGFRAPSTLRRADWIRILGFEFDGSFSDTDPYEPQPGGTCSIFPFFNGEVVELPYTLPQDHTLLHLLRKDPLAVWLAKAEWIAARGGMVLTLIHPDYMGDREHLQLYAQLLERLARLDSSWRALPSEVARWWRLRAQLTLELSASGPAISGGNCAAVTLRLADEPLSLWRE